MKRLLTLSILAIACCSTRAAIGCYPAEAGGIAPITLKVYGGSRVGVWVWPCPDGVYSWFGVRWLGGPDVRLMGAMAENKAEIDRIYAIHLADPLVIAEGTEHLPDPHN